MQPDRDQNPFSHLAWGDLLIQYRRLLKRHERIVNGEAIWRKYNRQTGEIETYEEVIAEIEANLAYLAEMVQSFDPSLIDEMTEDEFDVSGIPWDVLWEQVPT